MSERRTQVSRRFRGSLWTGTGFRLGGWRRRLIMMLVAGLAVGSPAVVSYAQAAAPSAGSSASVGSTASLLPLDTQFHSVPSTRLIDTRAVPNAALKTNATLKLKVTGRAGVPTSGVSATFLHITVANVARQGYLVAYPDGGARPKTSSLNYVPGRIVSNSVIVAVPANGIVDVYAYAGPVDVIVDISGWYGPVIAPGSFVPLPQDRLLDTRLRGDPSAGSRLGEQPINVTIAGSRGVPETASAAVLNVTVVNAPQPQPVILWAAGEARPGISSLNSAPGRPVAELVVVAIGQSGAVSAALLGGGNADLIIDAIGYIVGGTAEPGGLQPLAQTRLLDTRRSGGPMRPGVVRAIQVGGVASVPSLADAALVTITVVQLPKPEGYVTAWQGGATQPSSSNANPASDAPVAQAAIIPLDVNGQFDICYHGTGDVVVDLVAYFVATPLPTVVPPTVNTSQLTSTAGIQARQILNTANRYALNTWWPSTAPLLLAKPMDSRQQSDPTDSVRRLGMESFSLAVSLFTGAYSPDVTGVSAARATAIAVRLVDAVAASHAANRVGGWGESWQSAMWASYVGRAGWLLWNVLSPPQRIEVERMIVFEANFVLTLRPRYMVNAIGTTLTPGDTGAEEDSWYALAPALANAMMPSAPDRALWLQQQEQMQISAWARPDDVSSSQSVDGRPLSSWLSGSNVNANGAVVNHSRIAPDYSTNAYQSTDTVVMSALAGQAAPQSSLFGLGPVYAALSLVSYTATQAYKTPDGLPSGTIYYSSTDPTIYYPQGCDWGVGQEIPYALFDADADAFGFGGEATSADMAESEHAGSAAAMQLRPQTAGGAASGAMYRDATPSEYIYAGREEHASQLAAQLYLAEDVQEGHLTFAVAAQPPLFSRATPSSVESRPALPAQNEGIYRR